MLKILNEDLRLSISARNVDDVINRFNKIVYFFNQDARFRRSLHFSKTQLLPRLVDKVCTEDAATGTLQLDFQWLLDAYSSSGAEAEDDNKASEDKLCPLSAFTPEQKRTVLFSMDMDFSFVTPAGTKASVCSQISPGRTDKKNRYTGISNKRVCPHCGKYVSTAVGMAPELVVALAGSPRSGKTSCITAIINGLKNDHYSGLGISMIIPSNDPRWKVMDSEITKFSKGLIVTKTPQEIEEVPSYSYLIQLGDNSTRVLTFVDMPGEFWNNGSDEDDQNSALAPKDSTLEVGLSEKFYEKYAGLYQNIDCIWLFISKLAVHQVDLSKDSMGNDAYKNNQDRLIKQTSDSSDTILGSSPAYIRPILRDLNKHLTSHSQGMPPVAVILTKSEVMLDEKNPMEAGMIQNYNLYPSDGERVLRNNIHAYNVMEMRNVVGRRQDDGSRYLLEKAFYDRNQLVRSYIHANHHSLLNAIEDNCPSRFYIAMAAYGHPAYKEEDQHKATPPTPYHEVYPLLWTLSITRNYTIQHNCKYFTQNFMSKLLNLGNSSSVTAIHYTNFHYSAKPIEKKFASEEQKDYNAILASIRSNLLMNPDMHTYTSTHLDHPKR